MRVVHLALPLAIAFLASACSATGTPTLAGSPTLPGSQTTTALRASGATSLASADPLTLVNRARRGAGRSSMRLDPKAQRAAKRHARDMARAGRMAHVLPGGPGFAVRMKRAGIDTRVAENVATGQRDAAGAVQAWMNSRGHRRNMLDRGFRGVGVASAKGANGRLYWAMVLVP